MRFVMIAAAALSAILLAAVLLASPAHAERVFRASSIDIEQNERLDSLESRMEAVEASVTARGSASPAPVPDPVPDAVPVVASKTVAPPVSVRQPPSTPVSARYSTDELRAMIRAHFPNGWTGPRYADVSPRSAAKQHLVGSEHGFSWDQVNGLTQDEALALHDLAPRHGNKIFPFRSGQAPQPTVIAAQPVAAPAVQYAQPVAIQYAQPVGLDCANGQCARPSTQPSGYVRRGIFPLFGRR